MFVTIFCPKHGVTGDVWRHKFLTFHAASAENRREKSPRVSSLLELSLFHHNVDKMLKCISAPEAADPTNAWKLFLSRRFSAEAVWKVKMLWRQTSPVTPCFGQKIVTNIQRLETNKTWYRNPTKPAGLIRITTYDSPERLNFFDLWNLLRIWDCRPFSVLKTLTGSRAEKFLSVTKQVLSSEPSVNRTLDLRSIKHFRIAWLVLIDIW